VAIKNALYEQQKQEQRKSDAVELSGLLQTDAAIRFMA
jgi:hypothetical protein